MPKKEAPKKIAYSEPSSYWPKSVLKQIKKEIGETKKPAKPTKKGK